MGNFPPDVYAARAAAERSGSGVSARFCGGVCGAAAVPAGFVANAAAAKYS